MSVAGMGVAMALAGCSVTVHDHYDTPRGDGPRTVSAEAFGDVVAANRRVRLGMSQSEALGQYPADLLTLRSSMRVEGSLVEEWQAYALRRDGASSFERWLYFVDGRLEELRDMRLGEDEVRTKLTGWRRQ